MLRYLSLDIICSSKLTVFLELRSRKTVRFSEQITSADKYLSIFSRQMEAIVYIFLKSNGDYCVYYPSNIFRNTQDLPVCHISIMSKFFNWLPKFQFRFRFSRKHMLEEKVHHFKGKNYSVKDNIKIQVVDKVTGNLTTFREQDQSNIAFRKLCKPP